MYGIFNLKVIPAHLEKELFRRSPISLLRGKCAQLVPVARPVPIAPHALQIPAQYARRALRLNARQFRPHAPEQQMQLTLF
jgi:hypothetical protein